MPPIATSASRLAAMLRAIVVQAMSCSAGAAVAVGSGRGLACSPCAGRVGYGLLLGEAGLLVLLGGGGLGDGRGRVGGACEGARGGAPRSRSRCWRCG